jgi:hypothetical protein
MSDTNMIALGSLGDRARRSSGTSARLRRPAAIITIGARLLTVLICLAARWVSAQRAGARPRSRQARERHGSLGFIGAVANLHGRACSPWRSVAGGRHRATRPRRPSRRRDRTAGHTRVWGIGPCPSASALRLRRQPPCGDRVRGRGDATADLRIATGRPARDRPCDLGKGRHPTLRAILGPPRRAGLGRRRRVAPVLQVTLVGVLLVTGCSTAPYGGAVLANVRVATSSTPGFELKSPDVLVTPQGLQVHGALCRRLSWARTPTALRLEQLASSGQRIAETLQPLAGLPRTHRQCTFYTLPVAWRLEPGQTLRLSAEWRAP